MPFPLAHPAAVLPLKRFCGRWLNLPALVIGSLAPDSAYLFARLNLEEVSHRFWGIFAYCLPAGLLLTLLLYMMRTSLADLVPERYRRALLCETWRGASPLIAIVTSVLIGAATHVFWDGFTHSHGWVVEKFPLLQVRLGAVGEHNVRICRLLWYLSSFGGIAAVYLVYRRARLRVEEAPAQPSGSQMWVEALLVSALVVPIELVHDLFRTPVGALMVASLSLLLVVGVVWINSRPLPRRPRPENLENTAGR